MSDSTPASSQSSTPFHHMVFELQEALFQAGPLQPDQSEPASDPAFGRYIDAQIIAQQGLIVQRCEVIAKDDFLDYRAASIMQRSLALIDKVRGRIIKARLDEQRHELQKLKALEYSSQPDRCEAKVFLQAELAGGPRPAKELFVSAESLGISARTLKRAKSELSILSELRHDSDRTRNWLWSLPAATSSDPSAMPGAQSRAEPQIATAPSAAALNTQSSATLSAPSLSS